ncbi:MAG: response regulator [Gemmatimonadota bacterium]
MSDVVTVVIADDHPVFREGLIGVLRRDGRFEVVAEAEDGEVALAEIRRHRPAIAVLDINMPGLSGLDVIDALRDEDPAIGIVVLTMYGNARMFDRALELGADGYVLKDCAAAEIVACLHTVAEGRPYVSPALSAELIAHRRRLARAVEDLDRLTPAEGRVIARVARNLTTQEIADELGVSPKTVEKHRSNICRKLSLHGPQALLRFALEHRTLLEDGPPTGAADPSPGST